jgi:hypothetical protein
MVSTPFDFVLWDQNLDYFSTIYECITILFALRGAIRHTKDLRRPAGWKADVRCNKIRLNRLRRSGVR